MANNNIRRFFASPAFKRVRSKLLLYVPALFLLAVLQVTLFSRFPIFGATPNLVLAAVLTITLQEKEKIGGVVAIAGGVFADALGGVGVSLSPLIFFLIAYVTGRLVGKFFAPRPLSYLVASLFAFAADGIVRFFVTLFSAGSPSAFFIFVYILLPGFFVSVLFGIPVFFLFLALTRIFHPKEQFI